MSMDYTKGVYIPVRDETRKVTSYGQMNKWHDFKQPLSNRDRPRNKFLNTDEPIGPGVEIKIPTPEHEKKRHVPLEMPLFGLQRSLTNPEASTKKHVRGRKYLTPINSESEPIIANGRIVRPDPMSESAPVHLGYGTSSGYDDIHKTYLKLQKNGIYPSYPMYGPPRLRNGSFGGSWRHVKDVLQAKGSRTVFLDGVPRWLENNKIMNDEVPGTDPMYPLNKRSLSKAFTHPLKITQSTNFHKEAMRQTEGGNWNLLR